MSECIQPLLQKRCPGGWGFTGTEEPLLWCVGGGQGCCLACTAVALLRHQYESALMSQGFGEGKSLVCRDQITVEYNRAQTSFKQQAFERNERIQNEVLLPNDAEDLPLVTPTLSFFVGKDRPKSSGFFPLLLNNIHGLFFKVLPLVVGVDEHSGCHCVVGPRVV